MQREDWFQSPLFWGIADGIDNASIEEYILAEMQKDKGKVLSNIGGWQSHDVYYSTLKCSALLGVISAAEQWMNDNLPLKRKLVVTNMWFNVNQGGHYNIRHIHPDSIFSGVYYVRGGDTEDTGLIHFHRNQLEQYVIASYFDPGAEGEPWTDTMITHYPNTSKMILFPSWLEHEVEYNKTDEPRISVAFNTAFA